MDNKFNVKYIEDDLETMNMLEEIIEGNNGNRDSEKPVTGCLVIFNTENSKEFEYDADYSDATQKLQEVLSNGTEAGFFTLLQFNSCEGYYKIFKDDDLIYFQHRIALQMTYEDSRNFVGNPRLASELHNPEIGDAAINRSCYYNSQLQLSAKLKPFEFVDRDCMNNMFNNIIK